MKTQNRSEKNEAWQITEKEGKVSQESAPKKYGWRGWKMPISHLDDPDYCEYGCPVCTGARRGSRLYKALLRVETTITFGGCFWCRARTKKYGVKPGEPRKSVEAESHS